MPKPPRYSYDHDPVDIILPTVDCPHCGKSHCPDDSERDAILIYDRVAGRNHHIAEASSVEHAEKIVRALNAMELV